MQTSDSIIIIPTYNEKENIENIIRTIFKLEKYFHILIIEDNSPDGTADIVRRLQQEFPERLFMIERKGKLGLGTAYITGFKWAIEHKYDYIFEMDADFSHNPNDLPKLYAACTEQGADVAVGSRYCNGVNVVTCPACIKPAMMRAEMWQSAPGISAESMWSTGPWEEYSCHTLLPNMYVSLPVCPFMTRQRASNATAAKCWKPFRWTRSVSRGTPSR